MVAAVLVVFTAAASGCAGPGGAEARSPEVTTVAMHAPSSSDSSSPEGEPSAHGHAGHDHSGHMEHRFVDVEAYAARWNDPARDAWQQPDALIEAMEISPGMHVADLGVGTGYLVPHLAQAVGAEGRVLAVDIEQAMLDFTMELAASHGIAQVEPVLAALDDPRLPSESVQRIVTVNTWHHIADRADYARHLLAALAPGGSVWVVDFHEESPHGPPAHHRIPAHVVVEELRAAGFDAEVHPLELERQYVVVGTRR